MQLVGLTRRPGSRTNLISVSLGQVTLVPNPLNDSAFEILTVAVAPDGRLALMRSAVVIDRISWDTGVIWQESGGWVEYRFQPSERPNDSQGLWWSPDGTIWAYVADQQTNEKRIVQIQ